MENLENTPKGLAALFSIRATPPKKKGEPQNASPKAIRLTRIR
jgi:hypothetical protein